MAALAQALAEQLQLQQQWLGCWRRQQLQLQQLEEEEEGGEGAAAAEAEATLVTGQESACTSCATQPVTAQWQLCAVGCWEGAQRRCCWSQAQRAGCAQQRGSGQ